MPLARPLVAVLLAVLALAACEATPDADAVIERAQVAHGTDRLEGKRVAFEFRGDRFTAERRDGRFRYARLREDSTGRLVEDVLDNDGLRRYVDGVPAPIPDSLRGRVETAVNSVIYFALLPAALDDPAVRSRYLGEVELQDNPYHKIEVTFVPEGGGRDWEDRFVYWIHRDSHTVDYLAYYFHVNGGGSRFRVAVNPRTVEGIRFVDHLNYHADDVGIEDVHRYDALFEADELELLSEIYHEDVRVVDID